ncbi:MAG: cupin domain-containing protein [Solirubrobacteraceae bacterium]|nr:cupin domain-containing protein [Solirubrobacteraceae bacterium]
MNSWNLVTADVDRHRPRILATPGEGRAILLSLPAGERLHEHEVHERAWVVVVAGEVEVTPDGGVGVTGGPGHLFEFAPQERHEVEALADARLLLLLTPWPGNGHPGAMTLEEKSRAREQAAAQAGR